MKLFLALISFALGQAKSFVKEPGIAFTQQLVLRIRSLTLLIVMIIGSLTITLVGFSLLLSKVAEQLDKQEGLSISSGMILYVVVSLCAIGFLIYNLSAKKWLQTSGLVEQQQKPKGVGSTLENAVSLLIMDFVQARQERRENSKSQDKQSS